jgi:hypothetical protein
METSNKWTLPFEIVFAFSAVSGMLVVLSMIVLWAVSGIEKEVKLLTTNTVPKLSYIGSLRETVGMMQISTLRHILTDDLNEKKQLEQMMNTARHTISKLLHRKERVIFSDRGKELYTAILDCDKNYEILQDEVILLSNAGLMAEAQTINTLQLRPEYDDYQSLLEKLEQHITAGAQEREATILEAVFTIKNFCFFLSIVGFFIAAGMSFIVVNIVKKLRQQNHRLETEIKERRKAEVQNKNLIVKLQQALESVKQLTGFLPICCSCKKIRDDAGYWERIETYIAEHSEAEFTHGICPDCAEKLYPSIYKKPF